jgi:hypothetical protein
MSDAVAAGRVAVAARRPGDALRSTKGVVGRALGRAVPMAAQRFLGGIIADHRTRRFIEHNRRVWSPWRVDDGGAVVLADRFSIPQTIISYSYLVNVLARRHKASIKTYSSERGRLSVTARSLVLDSVYESFNATDHVGVRLDQDQRVRARRLADQAVSRLRSKEDVFQLTVLDTGIGSDVYQTYLGRFRQPTVALNDPRLHGLIREAVDILVFWRDFFTSHPVAAVVVSHDSYLEWGIISKVAFTFGVPVYLTCIRKINRLDNPYGAYEHFTRYREMFRRLPAEEQERALGRARDQLTRRLSGEVGVDMPYATLSAFHREFSGPRVLEANDRVKILVATHCFYDNPHAFGGMLFVDFYEWLRYLGRIAERTPYDWYVKVHPDAFPETLEVIDQILRECPRLRSIPQETAHHQLVEEGISVVLTGYGSVGFEYPALGVQVVNASYNPRIAYDFNWHPRTREEYERFLLNLDKLDHPIDLADVYEAYHMHHVHIFAHDLFLDSYWNFMQTLSPADQLGPAAYAYFLDMLTPEKHGGIVRNLETFVDSGKRDYFGRGPE